LEAARAAGGWLRDQAAAAGQAGLDRARALANAAEARARELAAAAEARARQLAAAADRIARERARAAQAAIVDGLSEPVASGSRTYQQGRAVVRGAQQRVGQAYDRTRELFGMDPPCPASGCPQQRVAEAATVDGSFLVPTEQCPADSIPADPNNVPAALAQAKAATVQSDSACCQAQPASVRNRTVYYVNGINTTPASHCKTLRMLRDMTCGRVIGIANDTEGAATDAMRTGDARQMIKDEIGGGRARTYAGFTPAVTTMKEVMVHEATSGGNPMIYAHSEGGAITSLAAIRAKSMLASGGMEEAMGNLSITSMGAAAPAWPDGPNYTHYIHVQDVVPNTLGLGDAARRPGAGAEIIRFGGRAGAGGFRTEQPGDTRPFATWSPGGDPVFDHYADTSYIPYINGAGSGCFGRP
jgi:hypothetical protein